MMALPMERKRLGFELRLRNRLFNGCTTPKLKRSIQISTSCSTSLSGVRDVTQWNSVPIRGTVIFCLSGSVLSVLLGKPTHYPPPPNVKGTANNIGNGSHWNEINTDVPCPISFTDEELESHLQDGEGWNERAEFWDSLEGFVRKDGWTANEDYDRAGNVCTTTRTRTGEYDWRRSPRV
jgi:hypothetical protein